MWLLALDRGSARSFPNQEQPYRLTQASRDTLPELDLVRLLLLSAPLLLLPRLSYICAEHSRQTPPLTRPHHDSGCFPSSCRSAKNSR